jgi:hypothetical protein
MRIQCILIICTGKIGSALLYNAPLNQPIPRLSLQFIQSMYTTVTIQMDGPVFKWSFSDTICVRFFEWTAILL